MSVRTFADISRDDELTYIPFQSTNDFPPDLLRTYLCDPSTFREISKIACVCKDWLRIIADNITGRRWIKDAGLKLKLTDSWMPVYRKLVKPLQILALDVSASMGMYGPKSSAYSIALKIIRELIPKLTPTIEYRGITCIAFARGVSIKECHYPAEVLNFFLNSPQGGFSEEKYEYDFNINGPEMRMLFRKIEGIQEENQNTDLDTPCQVTIISDFEDYVMDLTALANKKLKIHMQFFDLGKYSSLKDFLAVHNTRMSEEAQQQHLMELKRVSFEKRQQTIIKPTGSASTKNQRRWDYTSRSINSNQANAKKHKCKTVPKTEYEMQPLKLERVNLQSWQPVQEVRKITIL